MGAGDGLPVVPPTTCASRRDGLADRAPQELAFAESSYRMMVDSNDALTSSTDGLRHGHVIRGRTGKIPHAAGNRSSAEVHG